MSEETEFETKEQLEAWLREDRKVHPRMATPAADMLFPDFFLPSTLLGQSSDSLRAVGLSIPMAQHLSAKLERQQQQPILQRTVSCRMWVGEDMTFYELPAATFQTLISQVVSRFSLTGDQEISLYYVANKRDVSSRRYVSNDDDLNNLFTLAGKPILFVWLRGDPSMSSQSIPSQLELQHMSLSDSESISASSGRGYPQELFRNAVRMRDKQKCVLTGTQLRPQTGNVEAAHIFGVERSVTQARQDAGVWNAYDTQNGMLLESSLHTDFDSFFWCMDEFLNVHVSEAGRGKGLGYLDGKTLNLCLDQQNYPSRKILRARYALFLGRTRARESKLDAKKRRRKYTTAFTV